MQQNGAQNRTKPQAVCPGVFVLQNGDRRLLFFICKNAFAQNCLLLQSPFRYSENKNLFFFVIFTPFSLKK